MSKTVDSRVVEMTFDNKQFEKGISQSMGSIDALDKKLKKGEGADSMSNLGDSVEYVKVKFSALQAFAVGAIAEIGRKAVNAGEQLIKSLSVDQITAGFNKYSDKTTAMQTIVNATIGEEETMEEATDRVSAALDRLNWFTDETSYNFTDMVGNIGKFTAAGVDLDKSISAMEGIATWAGISGAGMQQASSAMYNFSQAMGSGAMMAQDWKSIENANMATKEFKETAIETAAELGYLSKSFDSTGKAIYKTEKGTEVTAENFRSTLAEKWFSADVMTATLNQYGGFADKLSETMDMIGDSDLTTSRVIEWIDDYNAAVGDSTKQQQMLVDAYKDWEFSGTLEEFSEQMRTLASDEYDLGRRSFKAAQEAKTFQEAIDATKDAVSTGWMNVFEKIFGNYYESKELWTELANRMYEAFMPGVTGINDTLDAWRGMEDSSASLYFAIDKIKKANKDVNEDQVKGWMERWAEAAGDAAEQDKILTEAQMATRMSAEDLRNTFNHVATAEEKLGMGGREDLIQSFWDLWDAISNIKAVFKQAWEEIFGPAKKTDELAASLTELVRKLADFAQRARDAFIVEGKLTEKGEKLKSIFKGLFSVLKIGKTLFNLLLTPVKALAQVIGSKTKGLGGSIFDMAANMGDSITAFSEWLEETDLVQKATDKLVEVFTWVADKIGVLAEKVSKFVEESGALDWITSKWESLKETLRNFNKDTDGEKQILTWTDFVNKLKNGLEAIAQKLRPIFEFVKKIAKSLGDKLKPVLESIKKAYKENGGLKGVFDLFLKGALFAKILETITFIATIKKSIKKASKGFGDLFDSFGNALDGFAKNQRAEAMKKIAEAVLIMVGAIAAMALVIHFLGPEVNEALMDIILLLVILAAVMKTASKSLQSMQGAAGMAALALGIAAFSAAIVTLVLAVVVLAFLPAEKVQNGLLAVGALVLMMAIVLKSLSKNMTSTIEGAAAIISFAKSVKILAKAVKLLGKMDEKTLIQGTIAIAALMFVLTLVLKSLDDIKVDWKAALAIVALVLGIQLLVGAVAILGAIKFETAMQGVAAIGALLLIISLFMRQLNEVKGGNMAAIAASIIILAIALNFLIVPVAAFGLMPLGMLAKGLGAIAIALVEMVLAVKALSDNNALKGAGALLILAVAINAFVPAILLLGAVDFVTVLKGLGAIGILLVLLVGSMTVLTALGPGIMTAALAVLALGAGLALVGVGMAAFAAGLATLVALGTPAIAMIGLLGIAIVGLITVIAVGLVAALTLVLVEIGKNMPAIAKAVGTILWEILKLLVKAVPEILGIVGLICVGLIGIVTELVPSILVIVSELAAGILGIVLILVPKIIEIVGVLITGLLNLALTKLPELLVVIAIVIAELLALVVASAQLLVNAIQQVLNILANWVVNDLIPWAVQFIFDAVLSFLTALDNAIRSDMGSIVEMFLMVILDTLMALFEGVGEFLTSDRFKEVMGKIGETLKELFVKAWERIKETWSNIKEAVSGWVDSVKDWFQEKWQVLKDAVYDFFHGGLKEGIEAAIDKIKEVVKGLVDKIKGWFKGKDPDIDTDLSDSGKFMTEGIATGLEDESAMSKLKGTVKGIASKIKGWFDKEEDINSPSKEFALRGRFIDEGLAEGINDYSKVAEVATQDLADDTLDTMSGLMSAISKTLDEDGDMTPTITPVLDLSEIQNGRKALDGMFSGTSVGVTANAVNTANAASSSNQFMIADAINAAIRRYSDNIAEAIRSSNNDTNVQVTLEGDAYGLFKAVKTQNDRFKATTGGKSAFI